MKHKWFQLVTLSSALCIASASWADTITWSGGSGNWNDDASWGGTQPTSTDIAVLNIGSTITVNLPGETAARLNVSNGGSVEVEAGGALALTGTGDTASYSLAGGNLLISGGAVTANAAQNNFINSGGSMSITAGSFSTAGNTRFGDGGSGTLTVSGTGSYSGGQLRLSASGTGNVSLTGSSATISGLSQIRADGGINNFNLTLGISGINAISTTGNFILNGTSTLSLDLAAYDVATYGNQVNLFAWGGTPTAEWDAVLINGTGLGLISVAAPSSTSFSAGQVEGDFVVTANSIFLDNLVVVPEPSALALLGVGLGLIAAARRRIR